MPFDRFLIAPLNTGLQTDLRPWLIPDDAFQQLNNAYIFRGRLRKRFGSYLMGTGSSSALTAQLFSRLRISLGNTDNHGNLVFTALPGIILKPGALFSAGDVIFTVTTVPLVVGNAATLSTTPPFVGTVRLNSTAPNVYQFRITGGVAVITPVPVYFYPAEPVMGLTVYELGPVNDQPTYAFDTQFAYVFSGGAWQRSSTGAYPVWHGTNDQYFWSSSFTGLLTSDTYLYTSNFNVHLGLGLLTDDPIWTFNSQDSGNEWKPLTYSPDIVVNNPTNKQPITVTRTVAGSSGTIIANYVETARIVIGFKNRLLLLNTIENNATGAVAFDPMNPTTTGITPTTYLTSTNTAFVNRCRFSHYGSPTAQAAWLEKNQTYNPDGLGLLSADGGGFVDASTEEAIISAEFIKDRLIVYFERSTWELVALQNGPEPFAWQKINTELGSESTFSTVPFDKVVLTIGNTGVHACNGANVERIDNKIPDTVFDIKDKEAGVTRVAGIRDYFTEMVYWNFPSGVQGPLLTFTNKVLVYNYKNGSWALNDDCITTWGYFLQQTGTTWASTLLTWEENNSAWASGSGIAQFRQVIAGNQQGFVIVIDPDESKNAPAMQITNITLSSTTATLTVIDHTLLPGDFISIENTQGTTGLNNKIYKVNLITDANTFNILHAPFTGTYTGGGTIRRVSNITILSKQWNPYIDKGRNVYVARIDFGVLRTEDGEITVDYYPSATNLSMIAAGINTGMQLGDSVLETSPYALYPLESQQTRLWHPIYFQSEGECIQLYFSFTDDQIMDPDIAWSDFEIEGMVLHTSPTSSRLQ